MRRIEPKIPENTFALTDSEIALIHAMSFYFASFSKEDNQMTTKAQNLVEKMEKQFSELRYNAETDFQVWE